MKVTPHKRLFQSNNINGIWKRRKLKQTAQPYLGKSDADGIIFDARTNEKLTDVMNLVCV